jgi:hypothetical protein
VSDVRLVKDFEKLLYPLFSMLGITKEEKKKKKTKRNGAKLSVKSKDKIKKYLK